LKLLESLQQVRFTRVYFTIFKANVWKILIFKWILLLEILKKFQNLGLEGKISGTPQYVHIAKFRIFNSKNVKNKKCVHTWANGTCYITLQ